MGAEDFVKLSLRYRVDFAMCNASCNAELAFVRGIAECGLKNTHGIVTRTDLASITEGMRARPTAIADELVRHGFWEPMPAGWRYLNWDKWQHDFEQVQAKRERDAERKRIKRHAEREAKYDTTEEA